MGIKRAVKKRMRKATWSFFYFVVRMFPKMGYGKPIIGPTLKRMVKLDPSGRTQTYVLNLNKEVHDRTQNVVLPIDMMKRLVRNSKYRAIMHGCLCRTAHSCRDYPVDHACIFIGGSAKAIVDRRMGFEATVDEALAHIDRGAELGLIGQAMWVEVEKHLFGFRSGDGTAHWLEICFCCPCCCSAFKLIRATDQADIKERFRSIGWKAEVKGEACNACGLCVKKCPVGAISLDNDRISIDEKVCLGCGFCAAACKRAAITLQLRTPLKGTVQDYFTDGGLGVDI